MRKSIFSIAAMLIFAAVFACAEEVRLTTIVPNQTTLRVKKGVVGDTYMNAAEGSIPASSLAVEGAVGIGTGATTQPAEKLDVNGNINIRGTPTLDTHAVTKKYVDDKVTWCTWTGISGTYVLVSGHNVASITKNTTGDLTINFTTPLSSANYAAAVLVTNQSNTRTVNRVSQTINGIRFQTRTPNTTLADEDGSILIYGG